MQMLGGRELLRLIRIDLESAGQFTSMVNESA
jgi:hypothetical protein